MVFMVPRWLNIVFNGIRMVKNIVLDIRMVKNVVVFRSMILKLSKN